MPLTLDGSSGITGVVNIQSTGSVLTGVTTVAAGSTSAPSISPSGDSNTGIFFPSADTVAIAEGGAESVRFTSTGNVQIANGNLVFSTAGTGIDFSATANSSGTMTSELLSDYEEGTWTPVLADADTGGNTFTHSVQDGFYTKVGNVVTGYFRVTWSNKGSASGLIRLRGFPFTSKATVGSYYYSAAIVSANGQTTLALAGSSTAAIFFDSSGSIGQATEFSASDFTVGMNGVITYLA